MAEVSVIIPVYNTEPWLDECLLSVCMQTLKDIEIICINDGSTDKSLQVLQKYEERDNRIIVIDQENAGVSHARNVGLRLAKGKYIYFLDSDDYIAHDALEILVREMKTRNLEILLFKATVVAEQGIDDTRVQREIKFFSKAHHHLADCKGEDFFRQLVENKEYITCVPLQMTTREFLIEHSLLFHEGIIHEDNIFVLKCLLLASRAGYTHKTLYFRRVRQNSLMDLHDPDKLVFSVYSCFICLKQMLQFCFAAGYKEENEEAVCTAIRGVINDCRNRYGRLDETDRSRVLNMTGKDRVLFRAWIIDSYLNDETVKRLKTKVKQTAEKLRKSEAESQKKQAFLQKELTKIQSSRGYKFLKQCYHTRDVIRDGFRRLTKGKKTTPDNVIPSSNKVTVQATKQEAAKGKKKLTTKISEQSKKLFRELLTIGNFESRNRILSEWYFQLTGETIDFKESGEKTDRVLLVEFNDYHAECIPGFYKYLSDIGIDVDVLINEGAYKENALDMIDCQAVYHCDVELMALMLQYMLMEQYKVVIFNSNAFTWKGRWHTVLQEFPFLQDNIDKIYVLEHQMEYLNRELLERGHVFVLTDKLPLDKRLIPVNCHWFGNRELLPRNKVTQFISVGAMIPMRRNFQMLLAAVTYLVDQGVKNFHIMVIGLGKLDSIDEKIRPFFSILGRIPYTEMYSEMKKADFFLTLLDPDNPEHDRYVSRGTSGSFQLIYGFSKPCLIEKKFAEVYGFSSENAIVYKENKNLGPAMLQAIDMKEAEYEDVRKNLIAMSDGIYHQSFENLKRTLADAGLSENN